MTRLELVNPSAEHLTDEEQDEFLAGPELLSIATLNPDGSPHVTPMWFLYRDGRFYLTGRRAGRIKLKNIERDPRIYFSVYNTRPPYLAVSGPATAVVTTEGASEFAAAIRAKYQGEAEAAALRQKLEASGQEQVVVVITPTKRLAWKIP
jgi:PPOX class probable F420-dependent enzyme